MEKPPEVLVTALATTFSPESRAAVAWITASFVSCSTTFPDTVRWASAESVTMITVNKSAILLLMNICLILSL